MLSTEDKQRIREGEIFSLRGSKEPRPRETSSILTEPACSLPYGIGSLVSFNHSSAGVQRLGFRRG